MTGTRPVVDFMFIDFILDAIGKLTNQIAKIQYMSGARLKMPVLLRGCVGIGGGHATHHSGSYYPWFVNIPGFRVVVPTTPHDVKGLMATALRSDGPVLFLEHKSQLNVRGDVPEEDFLIPFGWARVCRDGTDVTIVAIGPLVQRSLPRRSLRHWRTDRYRGRKIDRCTAYNDRPLAHPLAGGRDGFGRPGNGWYPAAPGADKDRYEATGGVQ